MKPSAHRVASRFVQANPYAGLTFFHGTFLKDALSIQREGFRLGRARGRGAFMGPGVYMGTRDFAEGYADDVRRDRGVDAGLLHLKINPKKPLSTDPKDWDDEFRALYERYEGPVPDTIREVNWPEAGHLARRNGYDAIADRRGYTTVVFDPSIIRVVKVEPMLASEV